MQTSRRPEITLVQHSVPAKPRLSFWQIWNMSFGFFGIQIGFMLAQSNMPRIFQTLGAEMDKIGFLMLAGPVTGLLVQPVIGYMSDRTWGRLGRRRPYFLLGAVLASLSLIAAPHSSALWMAASVLWMIDAANNISMEPFRAFVGDLLPKDQITRGFAFQTFFIGGGAIAASAAPYVLTHWFGVANTAAAGAIPDSVVYAFYLGAAAFVLAVLWTVAKTAEYPPEVMAAYHPEMAQEAVHPSASGIGGFLNDCFDLPAVMRQLVPVQFFTWFAWATMWVYATGAVTQHIYHSSDTTSAAYNEGASWVGICYTVYSAASFVFAFLLPVMASRIGRKLTHAACLAVGGISFAALYFAATPMGFLLPFIGIGLAWASTLSMPYAILACNLPAHKMGLYMGMFNMFIVVPQIAANVTGGTILSILFGQHTVFMLVLSGASMLVAAVLSAVWIVEPD